MDTKLEALLLLLPQHASAKSSIRFTGSTFHPQRQHDPCDRRRQRCAAAHCALDHVTRCAAAFALMKSLQALALLLPSNFWNSETPLVCLTHPSLSSNTPDLSIVLPFLFLATTILLLSASLYCLPPLPPPPTQRRLCSMLSHWPTVRPHPPSTPYNTYRHIRRIPFRRRVIRLNRQRAAVDPRIRTHTVAKRCRVSGAADGGIVEGAVLQRASRLSRIRTLALQIFAAHGGQSAAAQLDCCRQLTPLSRRRLRVLRWRFA